MCKHCGLIAHHESRLFIHVRNGENKVAMDFLTEVEMLCESLSDLSRYVNWQNPQVYLSYLGFSSILSNSLIYTFATRTIRLLSCLQLNAAIYRWLSIFTCMAVMLTVLTRCVHSILSSSLQIPT